QWQRIIETIWRHDAISGPFAERFIPGTAGEAVSIQVPAPTDALAQYGSICVGSLQVGCMVLATRSLFECVTIQVPIGMFDGLNAELARRRIDALDEVYQDITLAVFDSVPFDLANMGFQCECRLVAELQVDTQQRRKFIEGGYFYARDEVLQSLGVWPEDYPLAHNGLRWVPPAQ
ncbi:MAG: hypothetical protein HY866_13495, partial [Chloroflexi bacterium]|nr:hypothetical protein [Chloroflexota bacterium]